MHAFILAGGYATRLWPLTEKRPKPLLPLAGKPILTHLVERIPAEIPVTVSTNAVFAEPFYHWKASIERPNLAVVIEETKSDREKLGALGAVAKWLTDEQIDEDLLLLTGDNYIGFPIERFLQSAQKDTALLAAYDIGDRSKASAFGTVILGKDGKTVEAFEEKPKEPRSSIVATGCCLLPATTLPIVKEFAQDHPDNVGGIFEELRRRGLPVQCFTFREPWFDIGSFEAYLEATQALIGADVKLGRQSSIDASTCEGSIVLGDRTHVSGSTLENVVTFEDCRIENCVLRNCILDSRCDLRGVDLTGKMLREGTVLVR